MSGMSGRGKTAENAQMTHAWLINFSVPQIHAVLCKSAARFPSGNYCFQAILADSPWVVSRALTEVDFRSRPQVSEA